jgi:hypothetical protein
MEEAYTLPISKQDSKTDYMKFQEISLFNFTQNGTLYSFLIIIACVV